jgi:ATP-binding cassette, subfamily F, member 3
MITVDGLSKSYGRQTLFENIGFKVNPRERVGLVGRNGHGKTTLFRIIAGQETPDDGEVVKPKKYRIGYVEQRLVFKADSVFDEAVSALPPDGRHECWRAEKVLAGLGFQPEDMDRPPAELSGGYQVRLNLAKVLLADYQMILLDEPTNYLDITSIRWLERFLVAWPGELMLITHDRSFMDKVATHILGIHRRKVRKIPGDTGKYYAQIAQDEEIYEKTRVNDERKRKEMELFINRFRAKARLGGLVQSRVKSLEKMEKKEKLAAIRNLEFAFTEKPFYHTYAMDVSGLTFGYEPGKPLIEDFSTCIGARDRVFVVGRNGKGKTTLLKLLAGRLEPERGRIAFPQSAALGYFEQTNVASLSDGNTVLDEVASADADADPGRVRQICGAMMFEGDDALKRICVLSGGEKSRVMLAKLITTPVNVLLLDEPTNHLDMASSDALLEAVDSFDGAVIMVTHNEMFLDALADRLVVFDDDAVTIHEGGYQRFLEKVGWKDEEKPTGRVKSAPPPDEMRPDPRELRRLKSELTAERSKILKPLEKAMTGIEAKIEKNDARIRELTQDLVAASEAGSGARIAEFSKSLHQTKAETDALFSELERPSSELESTKAGFDEKLRSFEEKNLI